jgi:gifsy-2 prophage
VIEAAVIRTSAGTLAAATAADAEILRGLQAGKAYRVKVTQMSSRSLRHHRLFFGGLLPLAYEYWQPTGGLVGKAERETVQWVVRHMARQTGANEAVLQEAAEQSLQTLARLRAEKYGTAQHSMEEFRKWLTVEAGYYDVYETPAGIRKEAKSISFAQMDQEAFNEFYRACFQVAWNMMLSAKFDSEEAALRAAEEMMEMGT